MSESKKHMDLVELAYNWICDSLPNNQKPFVAVDNPESNQPNGIDGFVPDVYFDFDSQLYIGEAKTLSDFERKHSREQYEAYIKRCENYEGDAFLVISIPWQLSNTAKNYFRMYKIKNNYKTPVVIITDMNTVNRI